ncbi:MAG: HAD family hydrolase [Phycisphaerae bacterium]|jgi:histidinol-phosphate phosphatase family protein
MNNNRKPVVFLDRDGTIIEDKGCLRNLSDVVFFPETFEALLRLSEYFLLFIVTNQPGVAKGLLSREDVNRINSSIVKKLAKAGIEIADVYVCPHERSNNCKCIKPKPYFIEKAAENYHIDIQQSFVVGDHPSDIQLAKNAGAHGIFVLSGHGRKHAAELPEDTEIASGIMEAAERIIIYHLGMKAQ